MDLRFLFLLVQPLTPIWMDKNLRKRDGGWVLLVTKVQQKQSCKGGLS